MDVHSTNLLKPNEQHLIDSQCKAGELELLSPFYR